MDRSHGGGGDAASLSGIRLLLVLPQFPQDPASGAARSTRTIAEMLGQSGFTVRAIATTATEGTLASAESLLDFLTAMGIAPEVHHFRSSSRRRPEIAFSNRLVEYRLLDVGSEDLRTWPQRHGRQFNAMLEDELRAFRPDILFGYGGQPGDRERYDKAKRQGVKLVFALHNEGYLGDAGFFRPMDAVLTPSNYLAQRYRTACGVASTPLPIPLDWEDVFTAERDPIFVTMINPSQEKGLMFVARFAEQLSLRRPDLSMLFVESRGSAGRLVKAGLLAGFDLRRYENLMFSPPLAQPKEIYAATRTLLVPSLWQEPAGRVAAEALVNGIPPLVSDRGGLPEIRNGAGFVLPIPPEIDAQYPRPVEPEVVWTWIDLIERLEDDEAFYQEQSERARQAGLVYHPDRLAPVYAQFFQNVVG